MKVVSAETMAEIDRRSQAEFAFPSTVLMEDAGLKAWAVTRRAMSAAGTAPGRIAFVAGRGNNGGDALVMARRAFVEHVGTPSVLLAGGRPEPGTDPGRMLAMCETLGIECLQWPADGAEALLAGADWIVDGIAGTGLRGALRPPLSAIVDIINSSRGRKIAIDVPSGVGDGYRPGDPAVRAELTLTMGLPKTCLYLPRARALCGRIVVIPVGFPPALGESPEVPGEMISRRSWRALARRPRAASPGARSTSATI